MEEYGQNVLETLFGRLLDSPGFAEGLTALAKFPPLDLEKKTPAPYRGNPFNPAVTAIKFFGGEMRIAVAAHGSLPHQIPAAKLIAMVELMEDPSNNTITIQTFSVPEDKREGRPQILGRILPAHSAINIAYGPVGRPIRKIADILHLDSFQVSREVLGALYLAAKFQIGNEDMLDNLIASYEGIRHFDIPSGRYEVVNKEEIASFLG